MTKLIDVVLPEEQQEGTESMLSKWFKRPGEAVALHEPLAEVTTDKVNVEISSPAAGVLEEIVREEGSKLSPGEVIARIREGAASSKESAKEHKPVSPASSPSKPAAASIDHSLVGNLSPAVKRLLKEHSLDPSRIRGSGQGGRITHDDVMAFLHSAPHSPSKAPASSKPASSGIPSRMVPHSAMRRSIAEHMTASLLHTAPHVTTVFELDLSAALSHRAKNKDAFEKAGIRLTLTSYFVLATIQALRAVPEANSRFHTDALEIFDDLNIGIATALEDGGGNGDAGLIVPVLQRAQLLDLKGVAAKLQELTTKARSGNLTPSEVRNGTFTISNHGVSGSLIAAPIIINQPQSAILGLGKLEKRAKVMEKNGKDEIHVLPMMYVTLTIDHRVLDGFRANAFLSEFVRFLEAGKF